MGFQRGYDLESPINVTWRLPAFAVDRVAAPSSQYAVTSRKLAKLLHTNDDKRK